MKDNNKMCTDGFHDWECVFYFDNPMYSDPRSDKVCLRCGLKEDNGARTRRFDYLRLMARQKRLHESRRKMASTLWRKM